MSNQIIQTQCCIAGGGPAGMMLGVLLARAGIEVVVLEKHADFFRDFRGDTVHPSTLEAIYELGWLDDLLKCPHQKVSQLMGTIGDVQIPMADFSKLKLHAPYIAFMPQWDFLNFLAEKGKQYPHFKLIMQAELSSLIMDGERVVGAKAVTSAGEITIESELLVGADGRHSQTRELAGLKVQEYGVPIDVLWFRLSRIPSDTNETLGRFLPGSIMIMINRGDYWQCGYVIAKGQFENIKQQGLTAFHEHIRGNAAFLGARVGELKDWEQIKLLTVKVDRLERWYRGGLLCIGDAAHAMSPVGGVGINLAIQDAIATANLLSKHLRAGSLQTHHLALVQKRRLWPVQMTQALQLAMHKRVIHNVLQSNEKFVAPLPLRLLIKYPVLRRMMAYVIGVGFRPEHIRT